jgi:phage protein D
LQERASVHGFELQVRDKTLVFRPPPSVERKEVTLTWSSELLSFKATKTTGEQVNKVEVRGWDPINKKEIVGKAESPNHLPELEEGENHGGNVAKSAFQKEATMVTAREPIFNQAQADRLAQTILDELAGGFITARGTAKGNPDLQLGSKVEIKSVGKHFSGKYVVTQITHRFEPEDWLVDFEVTGRRSFDFLSLVAGR